MYRQTFYGRHTAQHQLQWKQAYLKDHKLHNPKAAILVTQLHYMTLVTRKPVFGVCDQVRLELACSDIETS